ncbi:MAG: CDP-alcohol phosphatidyltransferase family protein [Deltaproteobacteria bacterium]|nr:CDP-alcohol phosphatidyltransferase family protein [Deltaproteobacteria bacterium]
MNPVILGIDPKWNSLLPLVVINVLMLSTVVIFAFKYKKRPKDEHLTGRAKSNWVGPFFYEYWGWFIRPLETLFVKLGLTPNFFTTFGFVLSAVAGYAFATAHFGIGGWMMILGATCDIFDGRVARRTGSTSRSGAYYDSVMDRFGEGAVFLGLAYYFHDSWILGVVVLALIGSNLVSYARAKGDSMGIDCTVGAMQRPERVVYLGVGSIFSPPFRQIFFPNDGRPIEYLAILALIIIAVMTLVTAVYRMVYIMHKLKLKEGLVFQEPRSPLLKRLKARYLDI